MKIAFRHTLILNTCATTPFYSFSKIEGIPRRGKKRSMKSCPSTGARRRRGAIGCFETASAPKKEEKKRIETEV